MAGRKLGLGGSDESSAQRYVWCALGKGVRVERARGKGEKPGGRGKKGRSRHAQVLRKSDDLEKGRRQHPGTQA